MGQSHGVLSAYAAANASLRERIDQLERAVASRDAQIERLTRTVRQLRSTVMREIKDIKGSLVDMQDAFSPSVTPPSSSSSETDMTALAQTPQPRTETKS